MELRPRKGRSAQPPSTPTIAKPSPRRLPPQSSSHKKQPPLPPTSILIPSDDEEADPADAAPQEIYPDSVALAGDEFSLKQDNQDTILPDSSDFETPLSSIVKLRHAQNKLSSSNVKSQSKVTSSVKKMKIEELGSAPVTDTRMEEEASIANDRITAASEKVGLAEATTNNRDVASEETEKQEVLTGSVPQNSDELAVEVTVTAQEVCSKKTEVLSPSSKSQRVHSSKRKSGKKRDEDNEVVVAKLEQVDVPEHIVGVYAPIIMKSQPLSLILSDDEATQVSDDVQVEACEGTISASEEAALEKCSAVAEVSKVSSTGKKSRPGQKGIMKEENLSQKIFEEMSDITIPATDTEAEDQIRHELGSETNSEKEGARKIDTVEVEKCMERVSSTSKRHNFKSSRRSLREKEGADLEMFDSEGDKLGASDTGAEGKDIVNDHVQEGSEESSDEAVSSRDEDISNDHDELDAVTACSQKNAVHDEECRSSNDDDGDASTGSDDDDNENEMASIFFSSMKAHLRMISEPSEAKQEALGRTESQFTKSAVKEPYANGRSTGHGLSWSPEIVLSASKSSKAQVGKPRSVVEASRDTMWGRDRCLQDGLCVPPVDPVKLNKLARKQKDDTTGAKWFNLSAPTITPELKKELQLLKLRGALDPKRHYKAEDSKGLPKFFQVGTVVGGPADFYSGRLTKKEQKSSLASELLSDSSLTAYRKRKYMQIQDQKQAGGKGFWKSKKSKRTPAWAKL